MKKLTKSKIIIIVIIVSALLFSMAFNITYLLNRQSRSKEISDLSEILKNQAIEYLREQLESTKEISDNETIVVDKFTASGYSQEIYESNKSKEDSEKEFPYETAQFYLIVTDNAFFKTNARQFVVRFEKDESGIMKIINYQLTQGINP
ncbi:MAG: hypothetical protein E7670_05105 [Ruminococcaceae bacterium]|nr:hypothetical protein [Oscillospiraceae bacterium]